jgi:hypothetical protein
MRDPRRFKPSPAMVVACIALAVALTGTSYAAITLAPRSVHNRELATSAVNSRVILDHAIKGVDLASGVIRQGPPGPQGAAGAPGAKGDKGDPGAPATKLWAVVNSSGSIARSSGTTSAGRISDGTYEVIFNQDVSACAYVATPGSPTATTTPTAEIGVAPRSGNVNGVYVQTYNIFGTLTDTSFHLAVFC